MSSHCSSGCLSMTIRFHVVAAAQAVVGHREQAIRVRRQVGARDGAFLGNDGVEESRPWCENPLWSLRQHVEVSSTFSEDTGFRHGRVSHISSHFACWVAIEATINANAS